MAQAWLGKVNNIIESVFGINSPQFKQYGQILPSRGMRFVEHSHDVHPIVGVLSGALDDLENGFLIGQEFLIAGEVLDSVLNQASQLNGAGYKDPAAVLCRVVVEDSLKRLCRSEGIDEEQKASNLNDELKKAGRLPQTQWRLIQAWLDIGNAAAHGKFSEYDTDKVRGMIEGIEQFVVAHLG